MSSKLLDTSVCISVIRGEAGAVRRYAEQSLAFRLHISTISLHELWVGVARNPGRLDERRRLERFLGQGGVLSAFEPEDARAAGAIKADLMRRGEMIGAYDLLIAGKALARGWPVVTGNTREFLRVEGLAVESWES